MSSTTRGHTAGRAGNATRNGRGAVGGRAAPQRARRRLLAGIAVGTVAVVAVLFLVFRQGDAGSGGPGPRFEVGSPGPGEMAPGFELASTAGGDWSLADAHGETVLLYFQEGLMCQPCWDQITAIEGSFDELSALGVDQLVSITSDPLPDLRQKVADEGMEMPVLADEGLSLADDYAANQYGMMGTSRYGHSFVLVGPDGRIEWRADYGGAPDYTMFVDVADLLDDLRARPSA
jgi:peroxiredoxin